MNSDEESDTHFCLKCQTTIVGLDHYIQHKTTVCVVKRKPIAALTATDVKRPAPARNNALPTADGDMSSFMSSLELTSRKNTNGKTGLKSGCKDCAINRQSRQSVDVTEETDDTSLSTLLTVPTFPDKHLPITSLLTNLEFSSDSEPDLGEYLQETDDDDCSQPPRSHTGGKWKPGYRPKDHGKWKPPGRGGKWSHSRPSDPNRPLPSSGKWKSHKERQRDKERQRVTSRGGKWKPDCWKTAPTEIHEKTDDKMSEKETGLPDDLVSPSADDIGNHYDRLDPVPTSDTHNTSPCYSCTVCDRVFVNKYVIARHLISRYHHNRSLNHPQALSMLEKYHRLILRLSPFQCSICQFFCHTNKDLIAHIENEAHERQTDNVVGPQLCVLCRFGSDDTDALLTHLRTEEHETIVLSQTRHRPCVIREKRTAVHCTECGVIVSKAKRLESHMAVAHRGKKRGRKPTVNRVCCYCNHKFTSVLAMTIHIRRRHTKERPYHCRTCEKAFTDQYSLNDHEKTKAHIKALSNAAQGLPKKKPSTKRKSEHKCEYCDHVAPDYASLRPHYLTSHANLKDKCTVCDKTFLTTTALENHKQTQWHKRREKANLAKFACDICSCEFSTKNKLAMHRLIHQGQEYTPDNTASRYAEFLRCLPKTAKRVKCPECCSELDRSNIAAHLRQHEQTYPFACSICEKRYPSSASLRHHLGSHLGLFVKHCDVCDKTLTHRSSWYSHLATHRAADTKAVCDVCGKAFSQRWKLNDHLKTAHGEKHLRCTFAGCTKAFNRQCDFTLHRRIHTKEKPYLCDLCGYKGVSKSALRRHQRVHTGQRSFSCEHCPYKAKCYSHLRRHVRIHIGCKPYKCPYCEYTCNTHENIRKHIKTTRKHVGKFIYPCRLCEFGSDSAKDFKSHIVTIHKDVGETDVCSIFTGLYAKNEDISVPEEGAQVLPLREKRDRRRRTKRAKPTDADVLTLTPLQVLCSASEQAVDDSNDVNDVRDAEKTLDENVTENDEAASTNQFIEHGASIEFTEQDLFESQLIEVEIINGYDGEMTLTTENINLLVQQALSKEENCRLGITDGVAFAADKDGNHRIRIISIKNCISSTPDQ